MNKKRNCWVQWWLGTAECNEQWLVQTRIVGNAVHEQDDTVGKRNSRDTPTRHCDRQCILCKRVHPFPFMVNFVQFRYVNT